MALVTIWFIVIAVLWTGFFVLEGFDFGVGILSRLLTKDDAERRQILSTIAPVWDANEVWLVTGGIAIFAAFPGWYAAAFPAAYLPLLLVIAAIIVRGVAIEYRSKQPSTRWRGTWDNAMFASSLALPLLFGVFWAGMVHGIPIDATGAFTGESLLSFINPYSILGGVTLLSFCIMHGATFIALKTSGPVQVSAARLAPRMSLVTAVLMAGFGVWTWASYSRSDSVALVIGLAGAVALLIAMGAHAKNKQLLAFWLNAFAALSYVAAIFIALYPNALPSTIDDGYTLTLEAASASSTSLTIISIVALVGLPLVVAYQAWSFWVFRKRIAPIAD